MKNVAVRLLAFFAVGFPVVAGCDPSLTLIERVGRVSRHAVARARGIRAGVGATRVIDDFEDGDLWLKRVAGRTGSWVGFGDAREGTVFGEASSRCVAHGTCSGT